MCRESKIPNKWIGLCGVWKIPQPNTHASNRQIYYRRRQRWRWLCSHTFLYVCVCTGYLKTWWTGWVCDKDELIRFWWGSWSGYWNFKSDSSPLRETGLNWYIARYLKKLWTDSDETWWTGCVCDKDELIRFWWRSESGSGYENYLIFKSDSSPLRDGAKNDIQ